MHLLDAAVCRLLVSDVVGPRGLTRGNAPVVEMAAVLKAGAFIPLGTIYEI